MQIKNRESCELINFYKTSPLDFWMRTIILFSLMVLGYIIYEVFLDAEKKALMRTIKEKKIRENKPDLLCKGLYLSSNDYDLITLDGKLRISATNRKKLSSKKLFIVDDCQELVSLTTTVFFEEPIKPKKEIENKNLSILKNKIENLVSRSILLQDRIKVLHDENKIFQNENIELQKRNDILDIENQRLMMMKEIFYKMIDGKKIDVFFEQIKNKEQIKKPIKKEIFKEVEPIPTLSKDTQIEDKDEVLIPFIAGKPLEDKVRILGALVSSLHYGTILHSVSKNKIERFNNLLGTEEEMKSRFESLKKAFKILYNKVSHENS